MSHELHPAFGRKHAANILRMYADRVLWCIGRVDTIKDAVFFSVAEYGDVRAVETSARAYRDKQRAGPLVFSEFNGFGNGIEQPARVTLVNISDIVRRVRATGERLGLDLSASFFPPPGDPFADKIMKTKKLDRERAFAMWQAEARLQ